MLRRNGVSDVWRSNTPFWFQYNNAWYSGGIVCLKKVECEYHSANTDQIFSSGVILCISNYVHYVRSQSQLDSDSVNQCNVSSSRTFFVDTTNEKYLQQVK